MIERGQEKQLLEWLWDHRDSRWTYLVNLKHELARFAGVDADDILYWNDQGPEEEGEDGRLYPTSRYFDYDIVGPYVSVNKENVKLALEKIEKEEGAMSDGIRDCEMLIDKMLQEAAVGSVRTIRLRTGHEYPLGNFQLRPHPQALCLHCNLPFEPNLIHDCTYQPEKSMKGDHEKQMENKIVRVIIDALEKWREGAD